MIKIKIGYIRVSSDSQNPSRQEHLMKELGIDQIFRDHATGSNTNRPGLKQMINFVRKGDCIIVESIQGRGDRSVVPLCIGTTDLSPRPLSPRPFRPFKDSN